MFKLIETIINKFLDLDAGQMFDRSQKEKYIYARKLFFYLTFKMVKTTTTEIGQYCAEEYGLPSFDHSTVTYHKNHFQNNILEAYPRERTLTKRLEEKIAESVLQLGVQKGFSVIGYIWVLIMLSFKERLFAAEFPVFGLELVQGADQFRGIAGHHGIGRNIPAHH